MHPASSTKHLPGPGTPLPARDPRLRVMTTHTVSVLLVIGTALLTTGTTAQAISNLASFGKCAAAASPEMHKAAEAADNTTARLLKRPRRAIILTITPGIGVVFAAVSAVPLWRGIAKLRDQSEMKTAEIMAFLLTALLWCIIMLGSVLTLVATIIQLILTPG